MRLKRARFEKKKTMLKRMKLNGECKQKVSKNGFRIDCNKTKKKVVTLPLGGRQETQVLEFLLLSIGQLKKKSHPLLLLLHVLLGKKTYSHLLLLPPPPPPSSFLILTILQKTFFGVSKRRGGSCWEPTNFSPCSSSLRVTLPKPFFLGRRGGRERKRKSSHFWSFGQLPLY